MISDKLIQYWKRTKRYDMLSKHNIFPDSNGNFQNTEEPEPYTEVGESHIKTKTNTFTKPPIELSKRGKELNERICTFRINRDILEELESVCPKANLSDKIRKGLRLLIDHERGEGS